MFERAVINAGPLVAVAGIGKPGASALQSAAWQSRVLICPAPDPLLVMELDAGEAEVITLARQLAPCMVVIDERRGMWPKGAGHRYQTTAIRSGSSLAKDCGTCDQ